MSHPWVLAIAYATVCLLWRAASYTIPLWREPERPRFARPWKEVALALLAVGGVLVMGQLWVRGIRIPGRGGWRPVVESLNQLLIFAPILAVPVIRRHGWESAWLRGDWLWARLGVGLALACVALGLFSALEPRAPGWPAAIAGVFTPSRAHLAVQVLLEDVAIAILFVRVAAAAGARAAVLSVALLFAAAHVPTMLAVGASAAEFIGLVRDFLLGVLVLGTLWRSADVLWLWPVHFAMDMTQYPLR